MTRVFRHFAFCGLAVVAMVSQPALGQEPAGEELSLSVATNCDEDTLVFRIRNDGAKWPDLATISVLKISDRAVITQRSVRMARGQTLSFRVANVANIGEVGLWVDPYWYIRPFQFEAQGICP